MRKVSYAALGLLLVLGLVATASAAITIDGVITAGEWDGYIATDANPDNSPNMEVTRWGAKVEGAYLNWFVELISTQPYTSFQGMAGTKEKKAFPGLWLDVDASDTTWNTDGGTNIGTHKGPEWSTNNLGIDILLELGLIGNWVNGSNTGPGGEGPGGSMYNYWGDADDIGNDPVTAIGTNGNYLTNGSVMEARVLMSHLTTKVESLPDGALVGDYMKLAVGAQGTQRPGYPGGGTVNYGYDLCTPTAIASDPATKDLLPGDFNLDGTVDVSDLGILATNYNTAGPLTWQEGDATRDGVVDVSDLGALATNYNSVAAQSVPEPTTLSLLGLGALSLLLWRRKK